MSSVRDLLKYLIEALVVGAFVLLLGWATPEAAGRDWEPKLALGMSTAVAGFYCVARLRGWFDD